MSLVEYDNSVVGGEITFGFDNLSAALKRPCSEKLRSGQPAYTKSLMLSRRMVGSATSRWSGNNGATTYEAYWYHDVQFVLDGESAKTRGENIEWQTPTITGKIYGVDEDGSGAFKFRTVKSHDRSRAQSYLDGLTA